MQRAVKSTLENLTGSLISQDVCAVDGCSAPTWAVPLANLARAFARFGTGAGMTTERAAAAVRLREACAAHPWHVAGTGRFCTGVMQRFGMRAFVKTGAEGVYCAILPTLGLGVSLKMWDGAARAAEVAIATILRRLGVLGDEAFDDAVNPAVLNVVGLRVGDIRAGAAWLGTPA